MLGGFIGESSSIDGVFADDVCGDLRSRSAIDVRARVCVFDCLTNG